MKFLLLDEKGWMLSRECKVDELELGLSGMESTLYTCRTTKSEMQGCHLPSLLQNPLAIMYEYLVEIQSHNSASISSMRDWRGRERFCQESAV